ncbi:MULTISPECIES: hypothetical protein [Williamsia]|uniref:Uncharacterized protein n=1 Tax=Williamsia marianensis TaxID=85044 RepID=A0A495ITB1_WILMA|nr:MULTISPECIES: hypothetical protein [Williamsia]ETD32814.1 hypothetical protein W823_11515 [Williamsia sp. D3]PZT95349.1 MAG: hypothetical protein DI630_24575 [Gordonia sp. (in: high G+C Gram-positive bacteria)]RKR79783.1 hypothetical protein DFJ75_4921 [Williamsia muralis]
MKIKMAIVELHRSESKLARQLRSTAARHYVEPEIHHVALDLAEWSDDHVKQLADSAGRYNLFLPRGDRHSAPPIVDAIQKRVSTAFGSQPQPGIVLLADLRRLHRTAAGVSLDWELLAQGAQAVRDTDLIDLAAQSHPQSLRQMRWANAMLKTLSPQILAS